MLAILSHNKNTCQLLLDHKADIDQCWSKYGTTAFMMSCSEGDIDIFKLMVQRKTQIDLISKDGHGNALQKAAKKGHMEIVKFLLESAHLLLPHQTLRKGEELGLWTSLTRNARRRFLRF
jgi:ankyrin repeat protein